MLLHSASFNSGALYRLPCPRLTWFLPSAPSLGYWGKALYMLTSTKDGEVHEKNPSSSVHFSLHKCWTERYTHVPNRDKWTEEDRFFFSWTAPSLVHMSIYSATGNGSLVFIDDRTSEVCRTILSAHIQSNTTNLIERCLNVQMTMIQNIPQKQLDSFLMQRHGEFLNGSHPPEHVFNSLKTNWRQKDS